METTDKNQILNEKLEEILTLQKQKFVVEGFPSEETRIDRLKRAADLLEKNQLKICETIASDFGSRSIHQSLYTEVLLSIGTLRYAMENVGRWMKSRSHRVTPPEMADFACTAKVVYQPIGVVGVMAPWNFPWQLCFAPLAGIFSAGNRAMIKPSSKTPQSSGLMKELVSAAFDPSELYVVESTPGTNAIFNGLAFDHLMFTGSPSVGAKVLAAASKNLVPCTLELGGKNPVLLGPDADMDDAAEKIMFGKILNAGQICLAPDYVFIQAGKEESFIDYAKAHISKWLKSISDNPDYTSIIDDKNYTRLIGYIEEAQAKGVRVECLVPADVDPFDKTHRKIAPHIIVNPEWGMGIMNDEVFGPLLSLISYKDFSDAVHYVNAHERPLGIYYFGHDPVVIDMLETETTSGGMTVNDVIWHAAQEELPFGGIGNSGMGHYHGEYGFLRFSHQKAVFTQDRNNTIMRMLHPPR